MIKQFLQAPSKGENLRDEIYLLFIKKVNFHLILYSTEKTKAQPYFFWSFLVRYDVSVCCLGIALDVNIVCT